MRHTPAQRHRLATMAAIAATTAATSPHGEMEGSAYELMQAQLHEHRLTLKKIQSVERKIDAKRTMLADFDAYLDGVLNADAGAQDLVVTSVLVWHLDVGNWARALQLARYAISHALALPDQYNRDLATLLIDETSTAALAGKLLGDEALRVLAEVASLTAERDAPDQARAKLHKAIGYALMGKTPTHEPDIATLDITKAQLAMGHLQRAHELFAQVGVKKDMERLERRLKAALPGSD